MKGRDMADTATLDSNALATALLATRQPNFYQVSGDGITVTYSTTSIFGGPHLHYKDATTDLSFTGDQIKVTTVPLLGTVVTVVTRLTIDSGSTSFSLLIPRVNLGNSFSVNITTLGINTEHKFSIAGPVAPQSDLYAAHVLTGTARLVFF
jgi:hypothetical protein